MFCIKSEVKFEFGLCEVFLRVIISKLKISEANTMSSLTMLREPATRVFLSKRHMITKSATKELSTQCETSIQKLRRVFEEYRVKNYTQEIPSRFKKDIVNAAKEKNDDNITPQGLEHVLHNIGASKSFSPQDLQIIFREVGESGSISSSKMVKLL